MKLPRIEPNAGHVYIMQSKDLRMKVGSSYVPQARRDEVSWTNGGGVLLLWMTPKVRYPTTIERLAQKRLTEQGHHYKGEWFTCSVFEAKREIEAASSEVAEVVARLTATANKMRARKGRAALEKHAGFPADRKRGKR